MATGNGRSLLVDVGRGLVIRGVASALRGGVGNFLPVKIITTKHVVSSFEYLMSKVMRILKKQEYWHAERNSGGWERETGT